MLNLNSLDIEGTIVGARQNEYGRADQAAV
jgi:hypothetical protein